MGSVNSVAEAKSHEEDPSTNQKDVEESSKTLMEDLNETKAEEEEDGECVLCKYIKGGECRDAFIALEKCVDEAEKNDEDEISKCKEIRVMFKNCKNENAVYYEPILAIEASAIAKMLSDLYAEKEAILAGEAAAIAKALSRLQTDKADPVTIFPAEAAAIGKAFSEFEDEKEKEKEEAENRVFLFKLLSKIIKGKHVCLLLPEFVRE